MSLSRQARVAPFYHVTEYGYWQRPVVMWVHTPYRLPRQQVVT